MIERLFGRKAGRKIVLYYSEIAINRHKIITYLAISKSSEQF